MKKRSIRGLQAMAMVVGSVPIVQIATTQIASAQAAYGSYVGVGAAVGITRNAEGEGQNLAGLISFRYRFLELPLSLRAQAFVGSGTSVVPTISYDIPLNWQTDLYVGAGAAFGSSNGDESPSPVGDKTSFALQPGIDSAIPNSNLVLFGNAIIAFDAYRNGGGTALSIQGGMGLQF